MSGNIKKLLGHHGEFQRIGRGAGDLDRKGAEILQREFVGDLLGAVL